MIPIFKAKNKDSRIIIERMEDFKIYLRTLPNDVQITVSKVRKQRSQPQNSYLWGVVYVLISKHTGHTTDEIHDICKLQFNNKIAKVGKDEFKIGASTAALSTIEFGTYISKIVQWASFDLSLIIPEPSEVI